MKILFRSTVGEFYRQRAGFFLIIILLAFGFLSAREHTGIAIFLLAGKSGTISLAVMWISYTLMAQIFWNALWSSPAYSFVYHTRLIPVVRRLAWLGALATGFLVPPLLYGIWIVNVVLNEGIFPRAIPVFCTWLVMWLLLVLWSERKLRTQDTAVIKKISPVALHFKRPVSWTFWTLEWLFRDKSLTLLLCKAGAVLFTVATLAYYGTDDYDFRLPAIGLSIATLANIGLSYEVFHWETGIWPWSRSLPVSFLTRAIRLALVHFIILVPDFLLTIRYGYPLLTPDEILQIFFIQISLLLWYHSTLYKEKVLLEDSLGTVFILFIVLTILILYSVPPGLLAVTLLAWGGLNYYRRA